jgi:hypothetical protein
MNTWNQFLLGLVIVGFFTTTPAMARRSDRTGFNFGTTVRILNNDDRTLAGTGSDKNTKVIATSQAVNPYLGYSFGSFNLGLIFSAETKTTNSTETNTVDNSETKRTTELNGKAGSMFARFLFGDVFFFEGGVGVYQEKQQITTEVKSSATGAFTGETEKDEVKGVGPGYHMAAGIELQMGGGFYFTTAYQVRIVQLRDYEGGSDLGSKRSSSQKREVLFGIAHYYK